MDKKQRELKEFLEQQLEWTKDQARILDQIDEKLHQMKRIAVYAADHNLPEYEIKELNLTINRLKEEVDLLEKQMRGTVH
jgi:flagellin-like hook-associated protein FlgL